MAGIGLYGVWYAKCTMVNGVVTGYGGAKLMGKAISANFAREAADVNALWANNGEAERDAQQAAGGTLTINLDRLIQEAQEDLFGLTAATESVQVGGETVQGTGLNETGNETPAPVGVAFIRQHQENNLRNIHEAVIYACATFTPPDEEAQTIGEDGVTWQTPTIEGSVSGPAATGTYPWRKKFRFPTQAAAEAFITQFFAAS